MKHSLLKTAKVYLRSCVTALRCYKKQYHSLGLSRGEIARLYRCTRLLPQTETITTTLFGKKILIFNNYFWYLHSIDELFVDEIYKCSFANKKPIILDCGANIGLSIIYFKRRFPDSVITAFEPDRTLFANIQFNLQSFGYNDVRLFNKAVWNTTTTLRFNADGNLGGAIDIQGDSPRTIAIEAMRLREFLTGTIDFLKIDIEGAEFEVLDDCKDLLGAVELFFLEYHGKGTKRQDLHRILDWICTAGFRYHIKDAWKNQQWPFLEKRTDGMDQQLNIFCYRTNGYQVR